MRVIVVGGGIAGLGAAYRLREAGHEVVLLEQEVEPGGRCRAVHWNGAWAMTGALAFQGVDTNLIELSTRLGIYDDASVVDLTKWHSWNVLVKRREVVHFKEFNLLSAARHPSIPLTEKAKLLATLPAVTAQLMAGDPRDITSSAAYDDVNACEYFRRYAPTFVDYFLEPCMGMFCGYGEDDYSLAWTIWGASGRMAWANSAWSFKKRGAGRLTWALGRHFTADPGTDYRLGTQVQAVRWYPDGVAVDVAGPTRHETLAGDALVMAVPGNRVSGLMPGLDAGRRAFFDGVDYAGHHIVYYLLDRPQGTLHDNYLLPAADGFWRTGNLRFTDLGNGTTFAHSQWKDRGCRAHAGASSEELLDLAWADVVDARPELAGTRVLDRLLSRQDHAICKRPKGFIRSIKAFRELGALPRVAFCGDYLSNSTVGQSHWTGVVAAEQLIGALG